MGCVQRRASSFEICAENGKEPGAVPPQWRNALQALRIFFRGPVQEQCRSRSFLSLRFLISAGTASWSGCLPGALAPDPEEQRKLDASWLFHERRASGLACEEELLPGAAAFPARHWGQRSAALPVQMDHNAHGLLPKKGRKDPAVQGAFKLCRQLFLFFCRG